MPGIFYKPLDRRSFITTTLLGGAVVSALKLPGAAAAAEESSQLHLALLSDTHIPGDRKNGYRGFNPWQSLKDIIPAVAAAHPAGVVISGDLARLEGKPEDYREAKTLLEPLASQMPVYIGLGNHDDRTQFLQVFGNTLPGNHPKVQDRHLTLLEHPTVRILVLDSLFASNKVAGLLGRQQRLWLASNLGRFADRPLVLVVHHTLGDDDGDLLDADRLFALLRPHRHIKAIIFGHSHTWKLSEHDGIHFINLPSTAYNFSDRDAVGWMEAQFQPAGVSLTLHASAGNREDDGKITFVKWS